ncbi:MAG: nucleoside deaminase [Propionibacterium sp.]|nr:nucleoside deaminase [Propionibacterium sp.]
MIDPLEEAVRLAEAGVADGSGPFGAVLVTRSGAWFRGVNMVTRDDDPTAHAEVVAIRAAAAAEGFDLSGATMYASCQPCPMCLGASMWARVDALVYAATADDAARAGFDDARFYDQLRDGLDSVTDVRVEHRVIADGSAPFERWLGKVDRVEY